MLDANKELKAALDKKSQVRDPLPLTPYPLPLTPYPLPLPLPLTPYAYPYP